MTTDHTEVITRFAPSPTGHLHIGGARTAIFCWLLARHFGGRFRLRIEDTDQERSKQEYTDSILASMHWLGLDWDDELTFQSQRTDIYNRYIDQLLESGHAYWCSCTPEEVEAMREQARATGQKPRYNGRCRERKLEPAAGSVVRFKAPLTGRIVFDDLVKGTIAVDVAELDDMVLRRADGLPTYNLAVVVDDHEMGITHVIRGDDHVPNTPKQIMLYEALGFPLPRFGHVPMILGADRQKLSKRHGARAVIEYEQDGLLPQALVNYLVRLGWSHGDQEIFALKELVELFDGTSLNSAPAAFDPDKLQWLNAQYMRETPLPELAKMLAPFAERQGFTLSLPQLEALGVMFRERATNLNALLNAAHPLLIPAVQLEYDAAAKAKNLTPESAVHLKALHERFVQLTAFTAETIDACINDYVQEKQLKFKLVGPPLRVALAGSTNGPHIPDMIAFMGKEECQKRLQRALQNI